MLVALGARLSIYKELPNYALVLHYFTAGVLGTIRLQIFKGKIKRFY